MNEIAHPYDFLKIVKYYIGANFINFHVFKV